MSGNPFTLTVKAIEEENAILQKIKAAMDEIREHDALIGIPEEGNNSHKAQEGDTPISNAELLFIHSNGSPINNIPARDVLDPSLLHNKAEIGDQMKNVLDKALEGNVDGAIRELKAAGMLGANKAKAWFTDPANGWDGNEDITVEGGWMKNKKSGKPFYVKGKKSSQPLIDTGELRKAITSTIRKKGETK